MLFLNYIIPYRHTLFFKHNFFRKEKNNPNFLLGMAFFVGRFSTSYFKLFFWDIQHAKKYSTWQS